MNFETKNIITWIESDVCLKELAKSSINYKDFLSKVGVDSMTPDFVLFSNPNLDFKCLDAIIKTIGGE